MISNKLGLFTVENFVHLTEQAGAMICKYKYKDLVVTANSDDTQQNNILKRARNQANN